METTTKALDLRIRKIDSNKDNLPTTPLMKAGVIPGFNQGSVCLVGSVRSGKSTLLVNLLTRPVFYGNYFKKKDKYLYSPQPRTTT